MQMPTPSSWDTNNKSKYDSIKVHFGNQCVLGAEELPAGVWVTRVAIPLNSLTPAGMETYVPFTVYTC